MPISRKYIYLERCKKCIFGQHPRRKEEVRLAERRLNLVQDGEGRLTSHPTYICMPSQPPSPVTSALAAEIRTNAPHLHGYQQLESGAGSKRYK
jgi:hypothetical protein